MAVSDRPSALWRAIPSDLDARLERALDRGLERAPEGRALLWFRADDIAAPGRYFSRMIEAFTRRRTPLALAAVPAWLTRPRWRAIREIAGGAPDLWCWHQHGWRHADHEPIGKKQEFGPGRPAEAVCRDLRRGRDRLRELLGDAFFPAFTPPWNRCGADALAALVDLGFRVLSRNAGAKPPAPSNLPEFSVGVDLHTRREPDPEADWKALLGELESAVAGGSAGVMLHHQRMNDAAVEFLDRFLEISSRRSGIHWTGWPEMADPDFS
jgi:hypothetical protein